MHLAPESLLTLAESPAPLRHPHLEACETCRREVDALRQVLARLAADDVPEPSPLFWDHFSQRVQAAIAGEAIAPASAWWSGWRTWTYAAGACGAMALVLAVAWPGRPGPAAVPLASDSAAAAESSPGVALVADAGWQMVIDVAAGDPEAGDAIGEYLSPTSAELAVQDLDGDERAALASLLRAELAGQAAEPGV